MNAKVQEFIDKMKKEEKKQRDAKLISLGLIDETKSTLKREYYNYFHVDFKYDKDKNLYYKEVGSYAPIDVTDEEYQEILKYSPNIDAESKADKKVIETGWANGIKTIAILLFIVNIIGGIITIASGGDILLTAIFASYCILYFPLIMGFSKIVAVAEKKLQEETV